MSIQVRIATRSQRGNANLVHTNDAKCLAAQNVIDKIWTYQKASDMNECAISTIQRWVSQFQNGQKMHLKSGHPGLVIPGLIHNNNQISLLSKQQMLNTSVG
jgi:hypothetical protein